MAENKKTVPDSPSGKDLTSKIAKLYSSMPPEQRDKPILDETDIQNPELDQALD